MKHLLPKRLLIAFLVFALLLPGAGAAFAAESDVSGLDFGRTGSLKMSLVYVDKNVRTPVDGASFAVYQVGVLNEDGNYTQAETFAGVEQVIGNDTMKTAGSMMRAAEVLSGAVQDIVPDVGTGTTDAEGMIDFGIIPVGRFGIFLIVQTGQDGSSRQYETAEPYLVQVPMPDGTGGWVYDVTTYPKPERNKPDIPSSTVPATTGPGNTPPHGGREDPPVRRTVPDESIPDNEVPKTGIEQIIENLVPKAVRTGDTSAMMLFLGGFVAASGCLAGWVILWKKQKRRQ